MKPDYGPRDIVIPTACGLDARFKYFVRPGVYIVESVTGELEDDPCPTCKERSHYGVRVLGIEYSEGSYHDACCFQLKPNPPTEKAQAYVRIQKHLSEVKP